MLGWAAKRRLMYFFGAVFLLLIVTSIPLFLYLNQPPTCTDGKQNADEFGVDCGGWCPNLCSSQMDNLLVHWSRLFKVQDGVYDVIAFVENPNMNAGLEELIYKFKLYDEKNILVEEKFGKIFVNPKEEFIIFESGIRTGERVPKRVFMEVLEDYTWIQPNRNDINITDLYTRNHRMENLNTRPRLRASVVNDSPFPIENVEVTAILFDIDDNAIAVSATVVDLIPQYGSTDVVFTWKEPFATTPVKIDILPRVNLFTVPIK